MLLNQKFPKLYRLLEVIMPNKKIVLCDADDTIENLCETWIKCLNFMYGLNVDPEDVNDWNVAKFFPTLTKEQVYAPIYKKEFWNYILPIKGCFDVLKEINSLYDLYIVTATNYQTCDTKMERILGMFPFLDWSQFIIAAKKQLIYGDYLIDDGTHNFDGGRYKGILFDRPHNRLFDEKSAGLVRVYTWAEIGIILL